VGWGSTSSRVGQAQADATRTAMKGKIRRAPECHLRSRPPPPQFVMCVSLVIGHVTFMPQPEKSYLAEATKHPPRPQQQCRWHSQIRISTIRECVNEDRSGAAVQTVFGRHLKKNTTIRALPHPDRGSQTQRRPSRFGCDRFPLVRPLPAVAERYPTRDFILRG